jgi:hypothetical protein
VQRCQTIVTPDTLLQHKVVYRLAHRITLEAPCPNASSLEVMLHQTVHSTSRTSFCGRPLMLQLGAIARAILRRKCDNISCVAWSVGEVVRQAKACVIQNTIDECFRQIWSIVESDNRFQLNSRCRFVKLLPDSTSTNTTLIIIAGRLMISDMTCR